MPILFSQVFIANALCSRCKLGQLFLMTCNGNFAQVGLGMNIMSGAQAAQQGMGSSASATATATASAAPQDMEMPSASEVSRHASHLHECLFLRDFLQGRSKLSVATDTSLTFGPPRHNPYIERRSLLPPPFVPGLVYPLFVHSILLARLKALVLQDAAQSKPAARSEKEATASDRMEEDTEEDSSKAAAQKAKELGNAAYKARKFEDAIKHYDEAISLNDSDISFMTNKWAALLITLCLLLFPLRKALPIYLHVDEHPLELADAAMPMGRYICLH